jgi:hypothetical protein
MRSAACGGNKGVADSQVPLGYTLVDLRRVGEDCFALFMTKDTDDSPDVHTADGALEFGWVGFPAVRTDSLVEHRGFEPVVSSD